MEIPFSFMICVCVCVGGGGCSEEVKKIKLRAGLYDHYFLPPCGGLAALVRNLEFRFRCAVIFTLRPLHLRKTIHLPNA
jgi:hypothetical protein